MQKVYLEFVSITDKNNVPREDKFYPSLPGRVIHLVYGMPHVDECMYGLIDGTPLRTSRVTKVEKLNDTHYVVETRNTIYTFKTLGGSQ